MRNLAHFAIVFMLMFGVQFANAGSVKFPSIEQPGQAQPTS